MRLLLIAALVSGFLFSSPANGQTPPRSCNDHTSAVTYLMLKFNERLVGQGLIHDGRVLEVYASEDGGTWTVLVVGPTGIACIAASGEGWSNEIFELPGRPA